MDSSAFLCLWPTNLQLCARQMLELQTRAHNLGYVDTGCWQLVWFLHLALLSLYAMPHDDVAGTGTSVPLKTTKDMKHSHKSGSQHPSTL